MQIPSALGMTDGKQSKHYGILLKTRSGCSASDVQDAEWAPFSEAERQASGVSIGSGLSCTSELAEAGSFVLQGLVRK